MLRPVASAVAAVWLALGTVLLSAVPASATGEGPKPPIVSYAFAPAEVVVDAVPGKGSHVAAVSLFRLSNGARVDGCGGDRSDRHSTPVHCTFSGLEAGAWRLLTEQSHGNGHGYTPGTLSVDEYIVVPAPPSIDTADLAADGSVALAGTGAPGDLVSVSDAAGNAVCDVAIDESGHWSCRVAGPNGTDAAFSAIEENTRSRGEQTASAYRAGALSAPSAATGVVAAPIRLDPNWTFTLDGIDLRSIRPGARFSIRAAGLPPGLNVLVELHSDPVTLATGTVGGDGTFSAAATIPLDVQPGQHRIVVTLSGAGLSPAQKEAAVTIVSPPGSPPVDPPARPPAVQPVVQPVAQPVVPVRGFVDGRPAPVPLSAVVAAEARPVPAAPPAEAAEVEPEHEAVAEEEHAAEPAEGEVAPNILTGALRRIQDVVSNPATVASAFSMGLVLIVLAAAPAHLLNATIAEQYQRFSNRAARFRTPGWYAGLMAWMAKEPMVAALALIAVTAGLFGLADPTFGFNDHSLRLVISCAIALFFVAFVSSWLTGRILEVSWSVVTRISFRPLGLILTIVGVLVSRVLDFSPGFLIGLVLGLSMAAPAMKEHAWQAVAIRSSIIIAFGLAAWMGFSVLTVHGEPHDFLGALIVETCVAITTEGIVMLLIDLLPFKLLSGEVLFAHSRALWAALYLIVTVVFIVGVVAWEGHWRELGGSLWLWIGVVGGFALLCVAIYLYFRFWAPPLPEETADEEEPLARIE
ncbi:hypothetical protein [Agromyces cerinus]|uniref:Ig-like domain (Group 3) n=1 Tax=Agromyces cerinus subsp. cerinus TaxID=232089 RepID=A0A1N6G9Z4_9MICO|nr:hypothetical protein [Agromyces cerinus]SIO04370.1 hypothetical protein SAMN05443544_2413 [Agromyces cerinus subsp. cerinus]